VPAALYAVCVEGAVDAGCVGACVGHVSR
jgi:hypothetical protein